jgi:F0F1-type ATP synthase assembly protein I
MDDDLDKRIASAQAKFEERTTRPSTPQAGKGMGLGFRMASDFVAAVIVGLVLGWGVDALFPTSPWGLIVCLLLGFITGVRNVVRQARSAQAVSAQADAGQTGGARPDGNAPAAPRGSAAEKDEQA